RRRKKIMARLVTLFTGQWADLSLEDLCKKAKQFGYDGLELACWGDHFEVDKKSWLVSSRFSPANGPICRSKTSAKKQNSSATTALSSPAGAITSKSTKNHGSSRHAFHRPMGRSVARRPLQKSKTVRLRRP